ncbi:putative MFS family arabinose efflux permease [Stella humosa]|uniref:Putative MFS family arabinose efflux permease n=1 Tax=Stella humosa TaxID=94 RepID=A0A3N1L0N3_9PROT|nr:MFS transporter [Stella humosa]ROP84510.1 putative MFS family arabinose efflux permease [Stella humosa]BBK34030.1 MFS transporter [Stella humosa]
MPDSAEPARRSVGVFRHRGFAVYWGGRFLTTFAAQFISVSVGWHVYSLTRDPLDLGLVGLFQFLPFPVLIFVTGTVADRFDRRWIMGICIAGQILCVAGLLALILAGDGRTWPIFALLVLFGTARAFLGPASQSITPNLVPSAELATAVAWTTSSWQVATILGPVVGGLLYGLAPSVPFAAAALLMAAAVAMTALIPAMPRASLPGAVDWPALSAGFRYIWKEKVVLGAISLDLFAVLLGGAVALLPAYAGDILHVGPVGLGLLRAAPGVGALAMALWLTRRPITDHAGIVMFAGVAGFGLFACVFGLSVWPALSILALLLMGATDMISVYVRETLIQLWTPDHLRGRVNAVNMVFIGASNELGAFRAGVSAALIGIVPAVVVGGAGTMLVAGLWAHWFPRLRAIRRVDQVDRSA